MFDPQIYSLFLATALVLVLSPGPDTVLILSRTLASGTVAGVTTLIGTQVGNMIHAVLAGIGVSTVVLLFPAVYAALKMLGVIYLLYLAYGAWRATPQLDTPHLNNYRPSAFRFFFQGLTNNLANPKMIAFFLALFPQFVSTERGSLAVQSFVLGATLAGMAVVWIGFVVLLVGRFRDAVAQNTMFLKLANRLAAVTFVALACRLALEERAA